MEELSGLVDEALSSVLGEQRRPVNDAADASLGNFVEQVASLLHGPRGEAAEELNVIIAIIMSV